MSGLPDSSLGEQLSRERWVGRLAPRHANGNGGAAVRRGGGWDGLPLCGRGSGAEAVGTVCRESGWRCGAEAVWPGVLQAVRCGASALADFYHASRATLYFLSEGLHSPERHSGGVKGPPLGPFRESGRWPGVLPVVWCGASALADFYNASRATLYFLSAGPPQPALVEPQRRGEGAAVRPLLSG